MRKVLFWIHLAVGVSVGIVVLIMSLTGVLLMYEKQMIAWADRSVSQVAPVALEKHLPLESLLAGVVAQKQRSPESVTVRADAAAAIEVSFGKAGLVYVHPETGEILGEGGNALRQFFQSTKEWHRWLGKSAPANRAVTGACNLAFVFLICSGLFLWLPRQWRWQNVRAVLFFRRGVNHRARNFNWHNVLGIWCAIPLLVMAATAVFFSYPWATVLLHRITGEAPPAASAPKTNAVAEKGRTEINLNGWNAALQTAVQQNTGWQTIILRLPAAADAPAGASVERGYWGRPDLRSQLTIDRRSGQVLRSETFGNLTLARKIRMWIRTVHTGEAGGLPGQTLAGVASLGGVVLAWTGLALSWRRFLSWRSVRRQARSEQFVRF